MAYSKKTWVDRQVEFPDRRLLTPTGVQNQYNVSRDPGVVTDQGDALNAANLNELENRIEEGINAAMPKTGGTFTNNVATHSGNFNGKFLRNSVVANKEGTWQSTGYLLFQRK